MPASEHERLICLLLSKPHRARYRQQLTKGGKARAKFVFGLDHTLQLDERFARRVPAAHAATEYHWILAELRRLGAPDSCYALSTDRDLDGRHLPLEEAMESIHGTQMGTLLSCIPGQLAYYEGEDPGERYILHRQTPR